MIMIVTDGATDAASPVFQARNLHPNNVSTCHSIEVNQRFHRFIWISFSLSLSSLDQSLYLYDRQRIRRS